MKAVLGLGANLGDRAATLRAAVEALGRLPRTAVTAVSSVYQTAPVGYADQPDFYNLAVEVTTELSARALLGAALGIEAASGRVRTFQNAPRVVDIDLLVAEAPLSDDRELCLPHPRMQQRAFVLAPLWEMYPGGEVCGVSLAPIPPDQPIRRIGGLNDV